MTNGERIAKFRAEKGMTQEELAKKLGYKSRSSVNKIEIGQRDIPRSMIVKISEILEVSPLELLGIEDEISETGKSHPRSEDEWTALEEKLMLLSEEDLEKTIAYVDKLIAEHEE